MNSFSFLVLSKFARKSFGSRLRRPFAMLWLGLAGQRTRDICIWYDPVQFKYNLYPVVEFPLKSSERISKGMPDTVYPWCPLVVHLKDMHLLILGPVAAKEWNWGHHADHVTHSTGPMSAEIEAPWRQHG